MDPADAVEATEDKNSQKCVFLLVLTDEMLSLVVQMFSVLIENPILKVTSSIKKKKKFTGLWEYYCKCEGKKNNNIIQSSVATQEESQKWPPVMSLSCSFAVWVMQAPGVKKDKQ